MDLYYNYYLKFYVFEMFLVFYYNFLPRRFPGFLNYYKNPAFHLDFLFVKVGIQSKGIGQAIWSEIERLHPDTKVWETCTPYFEKRNIHFYINRCGFHAIEFFNSKHPDTHECGKPDMGGDDDGCMFRFEKVMKP